MAELLRSFRNNAHVLVLCAVLGFTIGMSIALYERAGSVSVVNTPEPVRSLTHTKEVKVRVTVTEGHGNSDGSVRRRTENEPPSSARSYSGNPSAPLKSTHPDETHVPTVTRKPTSPTQSSKPTMTTIGPTTLPTPTASEISDEPDYPDPSGYGY